MKVSYPVLLVEDSLHAQFAERTLLTKQQCSVWCADTTEEALSLINEHYFSLIVTDIALPDDEKGGITLARALHEDDQCPNCQTPIVAVTGQPIKEIEKACLDAGILDIFAKPLSIKNIKTALLYLHPLDKLPIYDEEAALASNVDALMAEINLQLFIHDLYDAQPRINQLYDNKEWKALYKTLDNRHGEGAVCATLRLNACFKIMQELLSYRTIEEHDLIIPFARMQRAIQDVIQLGEQLAKKQRQVNNRGQIR